MHTFSNSILCLLLFVLPNVRCWGQERDPFSHLNTKEREGLSEKYFKLSEYYLEGSTVERSLLDSAIMANPKNSIAVRHKGVYHLNNGEYALAFRYFNQAVKINPVLNLGYRGYIKLYTLHDYEGALSDLDELKKISPDATEAWSQNINYLRALAKKQMGKYQEAINYFDSCIAEVTKRNDESWVDVYVFHYRGICKFNLKDFRGAIEDFDKAILYYDKCADSYYYKGMSLLFLGEPQAACAQFSLAQEWVQQGYKKRDPLGEVFDEIYEDKIQEKINLLCRQR